jgi:hypothetical protein
MNVCLASRAQVVPVGTGLAAGALAPGAGLGLGSGVTATVGVAGVLPAWEDDARLGMGMGVGLGVPPLATSPEEPHAAAPSVTNAAVIPIISRAFFIQVPLLATATM